MRHVLLVIFLFITQLTLLGQMSDNFPFQALVAHEVFNKGKEIHDLDLLSGNETLVVNGFFSVVHRSGVHWEFKEGTVDLTLLKQGLSNSSRVNSLNQLVSAKKSKSKTTGQFHCKRNFNFHNRIGITSLEMDRHSGLLLEWTSLADSYIITYTNVFDSVLFTAKSNTNSYCFTFPDGEDVLAIVTIHPEKNPDARISLGMIPRDYLTPWLYPCEFKTMTSSVLYVLFNEGIDLDGCVRAWEEARKFPEYRYVSHYFEMFKTRNKLP
jgi:hypothetical protein